MNTKICADSQRNVLEIFNKKINYYKTYIDMGLSTHFSFYQESNIQTEIS